jgi:biopolymer transport protein ExbD
MAEIADSGGGGGHKGGKKRAKKGSTRVDMTPMVDLAFLLLTFFVLTSTFSKPKAMSLVYPAKPKVDQPPKDPQVIFNAMTFLLSEDRIFYYKGAFKQGETQLTETSFGADGVRKLLAEENSFVLKERARLAEEFSKGNMPDSIFNQKIIKAKQDNKALKVVIKTDTKATCKNFIDLIDELKINQIGTVAPVDITASEQKLLDEKIK